MAGTASVDRKQHDWRSMAWRAEEYSTSGLVAEWREVSILHIGTGIEWESGCARRGSDGGSEESIRGSDDERGWCNEKRWIYCCCSMSVAGFVKASVPIDVGGQ